MARRGHVRSPVLHSLDSSKGLKSLHVQSHFDDFLLLCERCQGFVWFRRQRPEPASLTLRHLPFGLHRVLLAQVPVSLVVDWMRTPEYAACRRDGGAEHTLRYFERGAHWIPAQETLDRLLAFCADAGSVDLVLDGVRFAVMMLLTQSWEHGAPRPVVRDLSTTLDSMVCGASDFSTLTLAQQSEARSLAALAADRITGGV